GSGIIGTFQKIPIIGDFASIIYTALLPIPFWSRFTTSPSNPLGKETYNIMNFPLSISSLFHMIVIMVVLAWVFSKKIRNKTNGYISKVLQYHLWIGIIMLYLQSAVTESRRVMAYYCIFYI